MSRYHDPGKGGILKFATAAILPLLKGVSFARWCSTECKPGKAGAFTRACQCRL